MSSKMVLYRNTKDRVEFENEADPMEKTLEAEESADWEEFIAAVELGDLPEQLGYDPNDSTLTLESDWSVSYGKSHFVGVLCYILSTIETNFIFVPPGKLEALTHLFEAEMSSIERERATGFGKRG